ncbi:hypothetical protein [Gilvibacter sp.]|uniref:hypothetical protein n=1 Tax=Gilvibacter sp. TaxID=2729997 RepID=UPI0025C73594|nr:hypothetical protein [Gilvibacter sp.]NQX77025.1 hypothetical protein [Gilvibacter sp.]
MYSKVPSSPVYQKALEIFTLSRRISDYLIEDLSELNPHGKENPHIYFTGDIIQQSVCLAPEILKAEQQLERDKKHKHADYLNRLTNRLYRNCERLEGSNSNGAEFVGILRKELRKFKKLQRNWMLTL